MNASFNALVSRAFEQGTTLPTFTYDNEQRIGVKVHKVADKYFVGVIPSDEPKVQYRTFRLEKIVA